MNQTNCTVTNNCISIVLDRHIDNLNLLSTEEISKQRIKSSLEATSKKNKVVKHLLPFLITCLLFSFSFILNPCPAFAQSLFYNVDFSDSTSQLSRFTIGASMPYSFNMSSDVERDGNPSGRFELRYGDPYISGSARSEINTPTGVLPKDIWIGYSVYLPASWTPDNKAEIIGQVHDEANVSPLIAILCNNGRTTVGIKYSESSSGSSPVATYQDIGPTLTGQWVDYVIHLNTSSSNVNNRTAQVWQNGVQVMDYTGPIGYSGSNTPYVKFGIYKWPWAESGASNVSTRIAYYDDIKIAGSDGSYALVAPPSQVTNQAPIAQANNDTTITLPANSVKLDGSASTDPDGNIASYSWSKTSGPSQFNINSANSATTNVSNLVAGTYVFTLTVKDNKGATNSTKVSVTVDQAANEPPVAKVKNSSITVTLPEDSLTLDGSPSTDSDGQIKSYQWRQKSGPSTSVIADVGSATTEVKGLQAGSYIFNLLVTDNNDATDSVDVNVMVNPAQNKAPVADVKNSSLTVTLPEDSVVLDGSTSNDPDGNIISYNWQKTSGPSQYDIISANAATTSLTNLTAGNYVFTLTVKDNNNATSTADVSVVVNEAAADTAAVVVVDAGEDTTVLLPDNSVTLTGTAADTATNSNIVSYRWSKVAGPSQITITNPTSPTTDITNLTQGDYRLQLRATASTGDVGVDTVAVMVTDTTVLPVILSDFSVDEYHRKAILKWTSVDELNSDHFEIERSTDGKFFEKIGEVDAKGAINISTNYRFVDVLPAKGTSYYRLKMVDKDGTVNYSNTISLKTDEVNNFSVDKLVLSASRKNMELTISSSKDQNLNVAVVDVSGKVLFSTRLSLNSGTNNLSKTINALHPGVFYVHFFNWKGSFTKTVFAGY